MSFLLGLTGNIGCGKSTVGALLVRLHGVEYVDADLVVHGLYAPGTTETAAIAQRFGATLLGPDGTIDRRGLGDVVMADPQAREDLQAILQPGIYHTIDTRLDASAAPVTVLDAIRLVEGGYWKRCQAIWVVTCSRDEQVTRLMLTRGFSPEQAALRVDAQTPQEEKVRYASAVIHNDGDLAQLQARVEDAWARTVAPALHA